MGPAVLPTAGPESRLLPRMFRSVGQGQRAGNVISGNAQFGVVISPSFFFFTPANDNLVQGNLIGTDKTGTMPVGNGVDGVAVLGQFIGASNNTIGGTISGAGEHHRV